MASIFLLHIAPLIVPHPSFRVNGRPVERGMGVLWNGRPVETPEASEDFFGEHLVVEDDDDKKYFLRVQNEKESQARFRRAFPQCFNVH